MGRLAYLIAIWGGGIVVALHIALWVLFDGHTATKITVIPGLLVIATSQVLLWTWIQRRNK